MKSRRHRVIYTHGGGRLGNQVMRFVHWMAWANSHYDDVEVLNFAFWPFAQYFTLWRDHPGCIYPVRQGMADNLARRGMAIPRVRSAIQAQNRLPRMLHAAGRWLPGWQSIKLDISGGENLNLEDSQFLDCVAGCHVTIFSGWKVACWQKVAKQQEQLRGFFRPCAEFERPAENFISDLRRRHDFLIGVLIRQSDYTEWENGRFYFTTQRYAAWIRQVLELYPAKRAAVIIAAEVRQDISLFSGLPCVQATGNPGEGGHWFEKWVELSMCDLIVTPPSTFSATAAFRGNVPLLPIVSLDQEIRGDQRIDDGMVGAARHPEFSRSVK